MAVQDEMGRRDVLFPSLTCPTAASRLTENAPNGPS